MRQTLNLKMKIISQKRSEKRFNLIAQVEERMMKILQYGLWSVHSVLQSVVNKFSPAFYMSKLNLKAH